MSTHEVLNQPPPLVDYALFASDRGPGAAPPERDRRGMAAPDFLARLRQELPPGGREARRAHRHGHDREAGWLGSAQQHDDGAARERRRARRSLSPHWP